VDPVRVTFDCRRPATHLVRVTQRFPATSAPERRLRMPGWVPGSYKIRDFGRHVQDLSATVAGKPAKVAHPTKDTWVVAGTAGKAVELAFDVYCRELTVDTSHVTADHAHLLPATLALYDEESRGRAHAVRVQHPPGWRVWSGLETSAWDGTLEAASDYDHLIDCPIEVGPPESYVVRRFRVQGVPHRHVAWQPPAGGVDWARVDRDMAAVCTQAAKVWGDVPFAHYTFLTHVAADHAGGLEHRNSTVLGADPAHLQSDEKLQTRWLPLVAHEYTHAWNVKRILPAAFQPYDLQSEAYTDLLWLFEGFTSYYELPLLYRAKVCDDEAFGKMMAEDLEMYGKAIGRRRTSVSQASRLAWTLLYQPFEQNVNRNISYYTKGMWIALCLDAELRRRKGDPNGTPWGGLDGVMRHVWRKHGRTGVGVTDDAFPDLVAQASGLDLRRSLEQWTHGTVELPIDRSLHLLGWTVKREWKDPKRRLGLGVEFKPGTSTIARIWEDMPAFQVLQPDDELVAALGYKWKAEHFHDQVAGKKAGDAVEVTVFREGRLRTLQVPLAELPADKITVTKRKDDAAATRRRKAWIGEGRPKPKKADKAKAGRLATVPPRGRHKRY